MQLKMIRCFLRKWRRGASIFLRECHPLRRGSPWSLFDEHTPLGTTLSEVFLQIGHFQVDLTVLAPGPQLHSAILRVLDHFPLVLTGGLTQEGREDRLVYHGSQRLPQEDWLNQRRGLLGLILTFSGSLWGWTIQIPGHCTVVSQMLGLADVPIFLVSHTQDWVPDFF